jgi:hypothetical protein
VVDLSKYFRIVSSDDRVLHIEISGFWSDEVIDEVGDIFFSRFTDAVDEISSEGPFILLVDLSHMAVMTPQAKDLAGKSMVYSRTHGQYKAVEVIPKALVSVGVTESAYLAGSAHLRIVVKSLEQGEEVIAGLRREMEERAAASGIREGADSDEA